VNRENMKYTLLIILLNFLGLNLMAQSFDCEEELFPRKDKRTRLFGYVNAIGEYRVPPKFLQAKPFVGRNAIVQEGKMFGIINCEGVLILPTDYEEISSFSNGKGWVKSSGLWGLADAKGRLLIKPIYEEVKEINTFSGTSTWVKKGGLWGLINKENGRFIVNAQYDDISNISDSAGIGRKLGFQDLVYYGDGRVIITEMKKVNRVSQNLFTFQNKDGKFGAFNPMAYLIIRPNWDSIKLNIPLVQVKNENKYGLKTFRGKDVIEAKYDQISKYSDGYCSARIDKSWVIFSTTGSISSPAGEISSVQIGKEGKAIIRNEASAGLWDLKQKKWILESKKQSIHFSNSKNWLEITAMGKCKLYDLNKNSWIETSYDSISKIDSDQILRAYKNGKVTLTSYPTFIEGIYYTTAIPLKLKDFYLVESEMKFGVVNATKKIILNPIYNQIKCKSGLKENYFVVTLNNKQGLFDESGKEIMKAEFTTIYPGVKKVSLTAKESKWGITLHSGEVLVEHKFDSITSPKMDMELVDFPVVVWKKEKAQLVNEKGNFLTEPERVEWVSLNEGAWARITKDGYKLYNQQGKAQGMLVLEKIEDFDDGSAPVKLDGKWGFINLFGRLNIPNQFEQVFGFKAGIAYAKQNGKWGVLKKNGSWLIKPIGIDVMIDEEGKRRLVIP